MKKLIHKSREIDRTGALNIFQRYSNGIDVEESTKTLIFQNIFEEIEGYDKYKFYPLIGEILNELGFNCQITRDGDTNNRSDGYIIDDVHSVPIEIKSPTEVLAINNKSIRQAVENKIVLLSRKFYNTTAETTSLVIGYLYPTERSGVLDLIDDVRKAYGFTIGIISFEALLFCLWDKYYQEKELDKNIILTLNGRLL
jgi:hypothetical protein